jgi:predicted RNase H-like HicB family nuclease
MELSIETVKLADDCYQARCLELPGCVTRGKSQKEAKVKMRQAIKGYLASLDVAPPEDLHRAIGP